MNKEPGELFKYPDTEIGKNNHLLFFNCRNGAARAAGFMKEKKLPEGLHNSKQIKDKLNTALSKRYGLDGAIHEMMNYRIQFEWLKLHEEGLNIEKAKASVIDFLNQHPAVFYAIDIENVTNIPIPDPLKHQIIRRYHVARSWSIYFIVKVRYFDALSKTETAQGSWNPYDPHMPRLFMEWSIENNKTHRPIYITDIAPTIAALLLFNCLMDVLQRQF